MKAKRATRPIAMPAPKTGGRRRRAFAVANALAVTLATAGLGGAAGFYAAGGGRPSAFYRRHLGPACAPSSAAGRGISPPPPLRDGRTGDGRTLPPSRPTASAGPAAPSRTGRREAVRRGLAAVAASAVGGGITGRVASAAPPMAVISEELGYFPVTDRNGYTVYVPARVKSPSTEQAVSFAEYLRKTKATMYGSFWCPHCKNQKELFGREAWSKIRYVECDRRGVDSQTALCLSDKVDGFPTWKFGNGKIASGEMKLEDLVTLSGYRGKFDGGLEPEKIVPSGTCR